MMHHHKIQRLVLLLFSCFLLHCSAPVWQKVDLAQRQGNLESAAQELETYLKTNPNDAKAYYQLGEIRGQQGYWEQMLQALKICDSLGSRWQAETANAREFYWAINIDNGLDAQKNSDYANATAYFQTAVKILPENASGQRLLGEAAVKANQPGIAKTALEAALRLNPKDYRARRLAMRIYFNQGDFQKTLAAAQILENSFSKDTEALRFTAYSLDKLDKKVDAAGAYERLIDLSASAQDVQVFAAFRFRCGEYDKAIELSRQAITLDGRKTISNLRAIAQMQLMKKEFSSVIETANEILAIQPDDVAALQLKQVSHAALGQQQALEIISHRIKEIKAGTE